MSFLAAIDNDKNQAIWAKTILSLAAISEFIKFQVFNDTLSILAVNNAKITFAEIKFNKSFFHELEADFSNVLPEGFEEAEDINESSYSFLVNSRHLAVLFKNLDVGDLEYICFKVNWQQDCPTNLRYKLLIEIRTKKLIIKKYQTGYQPVLHTPVDISLYEHNLEQVHHLVIEQKIPKQFLDMVPAKTEDFKIDVKHGKLLLTAFTKQVIKDRDYLKQPMSVSITLDLDELVYTKLNTDDTQAFSTSINFSLKDFKNFMNLAMSLNSNTAKDVSDDYVNLSTSEGATFEILFKEPGDPIVFRVQKSPYLLVQFIQITSEDSVDGESTKKSKFTLPGHIVQPPTSVNEPQAVVKPRLKQGVSLYKTSTPSTMANLRHHSFEEGQASMAMASSMERQDDVVTYGPSSPFKRQKVVEKSVPVLSTETPESEDYDDQYLGPTQVGEKPKSIFE